MLQDPKLRANRWDDEWNSEEVQNEIQSTGITREEWQQHRLMEGIEDDFNDVW